METDANEDFGTDLLNLEVTSSPLSFEVNVTNSTSDAWTTMSMTNISEVRQLAALTQDIKRYYIWVILAFGFPGNLASLVVILRMRCFGSPALYVATLAVVDNLALIVKLLMLHVQKVMRTVGLTLTSTLISRSDHLSSRTRRSSIIHLSPPLLPVIFKQFMLTAECVCVS